MSQERNRLKLNKVILVHFYKIKKFLLEYEEYSKNLNENDHAQFLYFSKNHEPYIAYKVNEQFMIDKQFNKFYV